MSSTSFVANGVTYLPSHSLHAFNVVGYADGQTPPVAQSRYIVAFVAYQITVFATAQTLRAEIVENTLLHKIVI